MESEPSVAQPSESSEPLSLAISKSRACSSPVFAVDVLEQTLVSEQSQLPVLPQITLSAFFVELGRQYNALGMECLTRGDSAQALAVLRKAETLCQPDNTYIIPSDRLLLQSVTLNNLACFFKAMDKPHSALAVLRRALVWDATLSALDRAATLLNLGAILSHLRRHRDAISISIKAINLLSTTTTTTTTKASSLRSMGWFNLGTQYEHLRRTSDAKEAYTRALAALGEDDHTIKAEIHKAVSNLM